MTLFEAWSAIANDFAEPKCWASDPTFEPNKVSGKSGTLTIGGMISELHMQGQITKSMALAMLKTAHGIDQQLYTREGAAARVKWCRGEAERLRRANA